MKLLYTLSYTTLGETYHRPYRLSSTFLKFFY